MKLHHHAANIINLCSLFQFGSSDRLSGKKTQDFERSISRALSCDCIPSPAVCLEDLNEPPESSAY
ncbi:hypothetical protein AKJ16_DCAP03292 [Drosera capensis]